eukprot:CAMPEP_0185192596 /NCGR_PEP_ID=MMETSP1140-20130426/19466_1 /TAXON_ID=298111 /ORGANISM="Pavlova sp., Strain CCMP459" /LENGTH=32 /DNA_ID= /DNA_START= /DNA_END= /DNA_ORIENTATION=
MTSDCDDDMHTATREMTTPACTLDADSSDDDH